MGISKRHGKYTGSTKSSSMPYIEPKNREFKEKLQIYLENKRNTMSNDANETNDNEEIKKKKKKQWKKKNEVKIEEVIDGFDINDPPLKSETVKSIKNHGTFRFSKYEAHKVFTCDRCNKEKKSKNMIKWTAKQYEKNICNGCYGEVLASIPKAERG